MILINLLPAELRRKEAAKIVLPEIPVKKTLWAAAAAVLALQVLMSVAALYFSLRHHWAQHETEVLSSQLGDLRRIKSRTVSMTDKLKEVKALTDKKFRWALVLNELSMTATRGVWLRSLGVEEITLQKPQKEAPPGKYTVMKLEGSCTGGSGQETALIGKYLKALKDSAYFNELFDKNIDLSNINQRKIGESDIFDFVVQCRFKSEKL